MRNLLALSAACLAATVLPALADESMPYALKETIVGTMIPQPVVTSPVPFDKTYDKLTSEQKARIAQDYESMPAGDEPPFPANGLGNIGSYLLKFADAARPVGPFMAAIDVSPDGHARSVAVYKSPDPQLTQMVSTIMATEAFKPAKCKGSPCAMQYVLRVDFPPRNGQHVTTATQHENAGNTKGDM